MNLTLLRQPAEVPTDEQSPTGWNPEWSRRDSRDDSPLYAVIVHDDDVHTCRDFVELLQEVFEYSDKEAYALTQRLGGSGRAAVWKGPRDAAEKKAQTARDYQPVWRRSNSVTAPQRVAEFIPRLIITVELATDNAEGPTQIQSDT